MYLKEMQGMHVCTNHITFMELRCAIECFFVLSHLVWKSLKFEALPKHSIAYSPTIYSKLSFNVRHINSMFCWRSDSQQHIRVNWNRGTKTQDSIGAKSSLLSTVEDGRFYWLRRGPHIALVGGYRETGIFRQVRAATSVAATRLAVTINFTRITVTTTQLTRILDRLIRGGISHAATSHDIARPNRYKTNNSF
jgi:hypothetical protein